MDLSFLPEWPPTWPTAVAVAVLALFAAAAGEVAVRWLRVPRLLGYLAAGALFGAGGYVLQLLKIEQLPIRTMQFSMNFAAAIILFDVGQRVSFGWVRRNPALLAASVLESVLTFIAVYLVMQVFDIAPLAAALIAAISMSTSPAVVLAVTREMRSQGQVTERTLLLTALNSIYAVVVSTLLLGWARVHTRGVLDDYLLHPAYLIAGSLVLAVIGARVFLLVVGFVGRDRAAQIMVMLAIVWIVFASAVALKLSALLALLACGAFVRAFDQQRLLARTDIGLASGVAIALFFALSAAVVDGRVLFAAWLPALALDQCARYLQNRRGRRARSVDRNCVAQGDSDRPWSVADVGAGIDADAGSVTAQSSARRADQCGAAVERRRFAGCRCADVSVRAAQK